MKHFTRIIIAALLLALLSACAVTRRVEPIPATLTAELAPQVFTGDYLTITESEGETAETVILSTDIPIRNFEYCSVTLGMDEDGTLRCTAEEVVERFGRVYPQTPVVLTTNFDGVLPKHAVRYTDSTGTYFYALATGGESGEPVLMPLER